MELKIRFIQNTPGGWHMVLESSTAYDVYLDVPEKWALETIENAGFVKKETVDPDEEYETYFPA